MLRLWLDIDQRIRLRSLLDTVVRRSEPGFTKFRFQDMTQYPEKFDQWGARYDVTTQLSGLTLARFFRIVRHILEPEFGETGLWSRRRGPEIQREEGERSGERKRALLPRLWPGQRWAAGRRVAGGVFLCAPAVSAPLSGRREQCGLRSASGQCERVTPQSLGGVNGVILLCEVKQLCESVGTVQTGRID